MHSSPYYIGIDIGTQGLSVVLICGYPTFQVVAVGEGTYEMVPDLPEECYEQDPADWVDALRSAMSDLRAKLNATKDATEQKSNLLDRVVAVGISGQMHGEVLAGDDGVAVGPARLWCDSRNEAEGAEMTEAFNVKVPKRATAARWLWTCRNRIDKARTVRHLTTPAGYIASRLTGEWNLGIGEASGMFPIDQATLNYDEALLRKFDSLLGPSAAAADVVPLRQLLPRVRTAGQDGGTLSEAGSSLTGLPGGIPVAPAEGDQPASLAGSLISEPGQVSCSLGTSVCANSVGDRAFRGVSRSVDHFCAPDGRPINMVWLRNGTTFMNSVVDMFAGVIGGDRSAGFATVVPEVLRAAPDCGGVLALPFMDDEPGLGVSHGGSAMLVGINAQNATAGNAVKAALLSVMFNLRLGSESLAEQGFPRTELILTGGLTKAPQLGQVLADVFDAKVTILSSSEEGTAWGSALMAVYRHNTSGGSTATWSDFLSGIDRGQPRRFEPDPDRVRVYDEIYERYKRLVLAEPVIAQAVTRAN